MSDYPAGAEHDSKAPYNEDVNIIECIDCEAEIKDGKYCSRCFDNMQIENKKGVVIDDLRQLIDLSEQLENTYFFNKLSKIILKVKQI